MAPLRSPEATDGKVRFQLSKEAAEVGPNDVCLASRLDGLCLESDYKNVSRP